jgi:hypothetical protein
MLHASRPSQHDCQTIVEVIHRYFWLVDHGRADETARLFTPTGRLTFGEHAPKPGTLEGAAIGVAMLARSKRTTLTTRHVVTNIMLTARDPATVEASFLLMLFLSEDERLDTYPESVADVDDVFVRDGAQWLIHQRTVAPVFNRL